MPERPLTVSMLALVLAVLAVLAGCGGTSAEPASTSAAGTTARPTPEVTGPPKPWVEMTFDERKRYMGESVLPAMAPLFRDHDPAEFAAFSCDTCHGADMRERAFAMPNPELPALYPSRTPEQLAMVEEHPEMVRFMYQDVIPTMQTLLGAQPYDEETGTGFSCYACHPRAVEDQGQ